MPTFKEDTDDFMKGPSGFKMKYSPHKKTGAGFPFKDMGGIPQYDATPLTKKDDKKVPNIPKKPSSDMTPVEEIKELQSKKRLYKGGLTPAEENRLRKLRKMLETGPGSYGNEEWDKE